MLKYEYLEKVDNGLVFAYYPEGDTSAPGRVVISEKGHGSIVTESAADFGRRYAFHAIKGIDPGKKSGSVAWY